MKEFKHWLEKIIEEILSRHDETVVISTGKSISGRVHIGIFRELLIADGLSRLLNERGIKHKFYFFVDDYDPAKHFPDYIPKDYEKYIGMPFCDIPDPEGCCKSYAEHYAKELIDTFKDFGLSPEIVWTSELYRTPRMKNAIRRILKNVDKVREILVRNVGKTLSGDDFKEYETEIRKRWPVSVVCEKCGKLQAKVEGKIVPNRVISYNEETDEVAYTCPNCGYSGVVKVDNARLKLTWRVDWPTKWYLYKVSCEPAGKDHMVKGGAYETGIEISQEIFNFPGPVQVGYEWLRFGEFDMKTHKGIIFTPQEYLSIGPPEALRYLILKTDPAKHISFRPELLPQLIDEYEKFERIYYNMENADEGEYEEVKFLYPLCQVKEVKEELPKRLPYRFAVIITQLKGLLSDEKIKAKAQEVLKKLFKTDMLSEEDLKNIEIVLKRAENWVKKYAPENFKIEIPTKLNEDLKARLSNEQKIGLLKLANLLETEDLDEETLQNRIFRIGKEELKISPKKMFQAVYYALIGKPFGPRLAPFIMSLDKKWVIKRLKEAANGTQSSSPTSC
ncbi:MAG: lysine--tRNA ligase [Candidatus Odinarchaeia archaeon]